MKLLYIKIKAPEENKNHAI